MNGWRDMNDYMQQNKLESVRPELPTTQAAKPAAEALAGHGEPKPAKAESAPAAAEASAPSAASLAAARRERRLRLLPSQGKATDH